MKASDMFSAMPEPSMIHESSSQGESIPSESEQLMQSFGETFKNKINQVQSMQDNAQMKMRQFAAGKLDSVHEASVAMQKANMGFRIAGLVREKVLSGFQTLQQMQ